MSSPSVIDNPLLIHISKVWVSSLCQLSIAASYFIAAASGAIPWTSFQIKAALFVLIFKTSNFERFIIIT
ncbi:MAG: hypothetical protein IJE02_05455 [Clostridia bacterium]|nr:hypothetical protein [Clostridia bacterium]